MTVTLVVLVVTEMLLIVAGLISLRTSYRHGLHEGWRRGYEQSINDMARGVEVNAHGERRSWPDGSGPVPMPRS